MPNASRMPKSKLYPWIALAILTGLNLLNYIDRTVLFAVLPLVQKEFLVTKTQLGFLTSAFLGCYMLSAPFTGPLSNRYSRRRVIAVGGALWSGLTLLTAFTYTYGELLLRHTLVGVGEAVFSTIAPTFVVDLFPEEKRGRILGIFYLAIPVGSAAGYLLGGHLAPAHGWRFPFYVAALPGFVLAFITWFIPEPERGSSDAPNIIRRDTLAGLAGNPAFWTATFGNGDDDFFAWRIAAMDTDFSVSGARFLVAVSESFVRRDYRCGRYFCRADWGMVGRPFATAYERCLLLRFCNRHGAGRSRHDFGAVFPWTHYGSGNLGRRILSFAEHVSAERSHYQFCRSSRSHYGSGDQHFGDSYFG